MYKYGKFGVKNEIFINITFSNNEFSQAAIRN